MVEVAKPDYLSLVNKSGSGFNASELVTSIVAAEIEPKKSIHTAKQTKNENTNSINDDQIETIKKLKDLLDSGVLSQEEFDTKKKEILNL